MSTDFGELVLLIGDFHTPTRAADIPACFKELLNTDKISTVICTGNVGSTAVLERLRNIPSKDCKIVAGETDIGMDLPETSVTYVGDFKLGVIHGHQVMPWGDPIALAKCAGRLGVDILVSGHTHRTHPSRIVEIGGKYLINPGSVTGACNALGECDIVPSFMLMAIQGGTATLYTYEERGGETKVTMTELKRTP